MRVFTRTITRLLPTRTASQHIINEGKTNNKKKNFLLLNYIYLFFFSFLLFLYSFAIYTNNKRNAIMLTARYDLYIGIGIGAVSVIIIILIATIIFCKCCVPSSSHRYFGRSVSHYAAINNIDAKTYFKPPQHLVSNSFS
jgi:hypothetical protein